jgi:TolA-binding protein
MAVLCRWTLVVALLWAADRGSAATSSAESRAFEAAYLSYNQTLWEFAEKGFADFVQKFPNSPRAPEAILFQAASRVHLANYDGAIQLLTAHQKEAGPKGDEYLFWLGEAQKGKGDYRAAGSTFASLVKDYPGSARGLEAVIGESTARAKLTEWPRVLELLRETNGVFQSALRARTNNPPQSIAFGYLLLGEAELAQKNFGGAEGAAQALAGLPLAPKLDWERQYLLCRARLAAGRGEDALQNTPRLLSLAQAVGGREVMADSVAFQAGLLERLGRPAEAMAAWTNNLAELTPAGQQRQAVARIAELGLAQQQVDQAVQILDRFSSQSTNAPAADLALLLQGELRLGQFRAEFPTNPPLATVTNAPGATNLLSAKIAWATLIQRFPQSAVLGKAQRGLGWCYWLEDKMPESGAAFQAAVALLPLSVEQADARFKLGEVQFRLKNFAGAITNFLAVTERYGEVAEVKTNLFEPALCQTVQAGLAGGDLAAVDAALGKLLALYPFSPDTERAVLSASRDLTRRGNGAKAREIILSYLKQSPQARFLAELNLGIASAFEQEGKWPEAIGQYDTWLGAFTNHEARAYAEYCRATDEFRAGQETNAFKHFTNFLAQFSTSDLVPLARYWVGDYYYYRSRDPVKAEENYQLVFKNKATPPRMVYEAQMMAGRAAVARQGWNDAKRDYFEKLAFDPACPPDLRAQAMFAYGDTLMNLADSAETNKLVNYQEAIKAFDLILKLFPTNSLAPLALGEKANCLLQWAQVSNQYDQVTNTFEQVIASTNADGTAWSIAKVGLGVALEKLALQKSGPDQLALFKQGLQQYLDVFNGNFARDDQAPDPFWIKKAGLEAGRLAESLQEWSAAVKVYERLEKLLPALSGSLEKRKLKAQENLQKTLK